MNSRSRSFAVVLVVSLIIVIFQPSGERVSAHEQMRQSTQLSIDKSRPFGVSATLANRVRDDEQAAVVTMMREAGVQWAREELSWDKLQRVQYGPYLWDGDESGFYNYDRSIDRMHKAGINILGLLAYNPAWFKGKNPPLDAWIGDWGDYVYQTVARYGRDRKQIKHWEIWNEPNLRPSGYESGLYTVQDYVRILHVAHAAAKAADPTAVIVLGGIASIWSELRTAEDYDTIQYLRLLHAAGGWNSFDVLGIHPYRPGPPEEASWRRDTAMDFEAELRSVEQLLAELGNKPIWLTEMGWSTFSGFYGVHENEQANFLVRSHLIALAHPLVERLFWYDLRDDTAPSATYDRPVYDQSEREFHYGMLRRTFPLKADRNDLRKPAFAAYRTMTSILQGTQFTGAVATGNMQGKWDSLQLKAATPTGEPDAQSGIFAYRYDGGGRAAVALWRVAGGAPPTLTVECACTEARVLQRDGELLAIVHTEGSVSVRLDYIGEPLYIEWGMDRSARIQAAAAPQHHIGPPFIAYWQANGGLKQFGNALTGQIKETDRATNKVRLVQYFERNQLAYFPELEGTPHAVQVGRLGDAVLQRQGIDWNSLPKHADSPPECLLFAETGHRLCPPFRQYWEANGGLAMYGMPLSEASDITGRPVQFFERSRFEYFPEHQGTPFEIQLGLLGQELYTTWWAWPK